MMRRYTRLSNGFSWKIENQPPNATGAAGRSGRPPAEAWRALYSKSPLH